MVSEHGQGSRSRWYIMGHRHSQPTTCLLISTIMFSEVCFVPMFLQLQILILCGNCFCVCIFFSFSISLMLGYGAESKRTGVKLVLKCFSRSQHSQRPSRFVSCQKYVPCQTATNDTRHWRVAKPSEVRALPDCQPMTR